jgi:hypothetical protein
VILGDSDLFLYAISAAQEMSWEAFKRVYDALVLREGSLAEGKEPNTHDRWRLLRLLDALGHVDTEFSKSGGRLFVAPATLVRLPILGLPQAILCGARGPQTASQLEEEASAIDERVLKMYATRQDTEYPFTPRRILVEAQSARDLLLLAQRVGITYVDPPPAKGMLEFAASLDGYLSSCNWMVRPELNWVRRDFDLEHRQFHQPSGSVSPLRLSGYDDPVRQIRVYFLWRGDVAAPVDLDWGRYAALQVAKTPVLFYDADSYSLAVPSGAPLPRILARAVTLCSGSIPCRVSEGDLKTREAVRGSYDVYAKITPSIAALLAAKLGQHITHASLKTQNRRKQ